MADHSLQNGLEPGTHPVNLQEARRVDMKPSSIQYSQYTITDKLEMRRDFLCVHTRERSLLDLFKALLNGSVTPEDLGPIKVVEYNYAFYVYDGNKRLFVYKRLEQDNVLKTIPVLVIPLEDEHFKARLQARRYGFTITCRDDLRIEQKMNSALEWWICGQTILYLFIFGLVVFLLLSLMHYTMTRTD